VSAVVLIGLCAPCAPSCTSLTGCPWVRSHARQRRCSRRPAKTDIFLGERYRRLVKRRGKLKALVAVARSILVIVWPLLANPTARFHDLGSATTPAASTLNAGCCIGRRGPPLRAAGFAFHPRCCICNSHQIASD
jgi:hypothetical protein